MNELITRLMFSQERLTEIKKNGFEGLSEPVLGFFKEGVEFAILLCDTWHILNDTASENIPLEQLKQINVSLYEGIMPDNYDNSFNNPTVAVGLFGLELGQLLAAVQAELRGAIPSLYEGDCEELDIRLELLLELYSCFLNAAEEESCVSTEAIRDILTSFYHDYYDMETVKKIRNTTIPNQNKALSQLLDAADSSNPEAGIKSLYLSGEYISDNETEMYDFLLSLPEAELQAMADTYTGGYVKGFEVTGRDLSIKATTELRFNIGFAPMIRLARLNLQKYNLKCTMMRAGYSLFTGRSVDKNGVFGANPNPQFDFDHKSDLALIMSHDLLEYRLECLARAYEDMKKEARGVAGPAVVDIFGEPVFEPRIKDEASDYNDLTRPFVTEFAARAGQIVNRYIPGDERSFTIIAFPMPSIGNRFEEIFKDTIRINTLDYVIYRDIQQKIIDALDTAEYIYVRGCGINRTELRIHLHKLEDASKQTNFENCVADVNIPVGEVFTSPVLQGTNGILHVSRVFLNGLAYHNLTIEIKDGYIASYHCDDGDKLIEENVLYHHKTLPMGECAIGTNTTAYAVGRKYSIEDKLPILIAEKTGPHFAFGDTCYSHCEDLKVYNPDGKEIIARDNECSALRKTDMSKAYFNCHTDITIPYDELGEVSAVATDGSKISVIENGRFVLPGCEELNYVL